MEVEFEQLYGTHFDGFMRHYLTMKTGEIPNVREVYEAFRSHARSPVVAQAGVEVLVKDIRDFGRYFCAIALGAEIAPNLKVAFHDLRELKVEVAYPFLLELYHDYVIGILPGRLRRGAVRLVEAYVFSPRHLRHPDQLAEQDLRHVHEGAKEGSLPRKHPGTSARTTVVSTFSD